MSQASEAWARTSPPRATPAGRRAGHPTERGAVTGLAEGVYRHSLERPQALALSAPGGQLSYAQLASQAAGLARALAASASWPTDGRVPRVGILASRSAEACIAALGAGWAGATYVPIGLKLPQERLLGILARGGLSALVTDARGAQLLTDRVLQAAPGHVQVLGEPPPARLAGRVHWQAAQDLGGGPVQPPRPMAPADTAYIIFTSGTTGEPKGVMLPVAAACHYLRSMRTLLGLEPGDRVLDIFELGFDVSVHNMFCTWDAGAALYMLPPSRVMNAVAFVREHGLTVWSSVPSLVGLLRQVRALPPGAMPSLRLSLFGGEQLTQDIVQAWQVAAPASAIYNVYGPTEATVTCLAQRVGQPPALLAGRDVLAIGRPLPGCQAEVLDAHGQALPPGQAGELAIAGAQLASGYLDAPELTAARFVQRGGRRWYLTGDLAVQDDQGRFHCLGRLDNQVKVLGHRVELEDVDAHLRQVADGAMVASVAWPLADGKAQGLVAFVSGERACEAAMLKALRSRLPPYMLPSRLVRIAVIPLNANGKVDRLALRQMLEAGLV